jgi:putative tryptophan/tyrosine transport system substrate-binding protein
MNGEAMKRREFIGLLGGAATIPFVAHAQQSERMRSIGVLLPASPNDPVFQARLAAFHQELALLGWIIGRNVGIDTRWATTNPAEIRRNATELVALAPDVILSTSDSTVPPLLQATRTVPLCSRSPTIRSARATSREGLVSPLGWLYMIQRL